MKESDIVFVTAQQLYNSKSPFNANTHLMRHGVNVSHFMSARDEKVKVNPVIGDLPDPVIGFFGRIDDWIDLELIAGVAEAHPDWSVVMIGRVATDIAILEKLKNVHFLGQVPYEELPGYCKGFNVGLVPFKRNELTESVNPLKLYEYMAAGIPVASVGLPEVMEYKDITWIGDGKESFLKAVEAALSGLDEGMIRKREAILAELPWERKVEKISELIEKTLQS
jgi:glycosyltransferase involved in cell wall biosynthesis